MRLSRSVVIAAILAMSVSLPRAASALLVGDIDDFEDGTTENWVVNLLGMGVHPAPPVNEPTGGPAGVDDNFMRLTAVGGGQVAGSRLSVINVSQWAGDYIGAGIDAIEMDLNNFGIVDLALRLLFADPMGGPPVNVAFSTAPVFLPAGSGWTSVVFPISPASLTAGLGDVVDALTNTTELRLFHSPSAEFPGPPISASLGVDNIEAASVTAVPEPSTLALLGFGPLARLLWPKRREMNVRLTGA